MTKKFTINESGLVLYNKKSIKKKQNSITQLSFLLIYKYAAYYPALTPANVPKAAQSNNELPPSLFL